MLRELDLNQRSHHKDGTLSTNLMPICPHQDKILFSSGISQKVVFIMRTCPPQAIDEIRERALRYGK